MFKLFFDLNTICLVLKNDKDILDILKYWNKQENVIISFLCEDFEEIEKNEIIINNLNFFKNICFLKDNRYKYCNDIFDILIDINENNCIKWQKSGGISIIYKNCKQLNNAIFYLLNNLEQK